MSFTRRDFLASSAVAVAAGAIGRRAAARAWQAQPAQQPPVVTPVFTEIRRGVGFFTGRGGTIGYLINASGVVVVDAQFPDSAKLCLDGLNERSRNRPVDWLINTHHHGDHTAGNIVFKGVARKVVAHERVPALMKEPPGAKPPATEQLYPDTTFAATWAQDVGDERISAKYYGVAHTSGDAAITFERANVVHMGDLILNRRQAIIDRAAGASIKNWISVLERAAADHPADAIYIFGHAGAKLPVTGARADLMKQRDYFTALLEFVRGQMKAGRTKDEIVAIKDLLKGFEEFGPFDGNPQNARGPLPVAFDELAAG
jgi:glyoxylase-like metal-dependent hydrolase (beta-lactamase superfamily II)